MPRLEYDVVFNIEQGSVQTLEQSLNNIGAEGIDKADQAAKGLNKTFSRTAESAEDIGDSISLSSQDMERFQQNTADASVAMQRMDDASRQAASGTQSMSKSVNNSNQILFSFGDAMQDGAQFQQSFGAGARAVGNNLTFAAEQIALANNKTGSLGGTLKSLGSAMLGPAGVVFAVNAAVTAITVWSNMTSDAKKSTDQFTSSLKQFADEATSIGTDQLFDPLGTISAEKQIGRLQSLQSELDKLFQLRERQAEINTTISTLRQAGISDNDDLNEILRNQQQQLFSVNNQISILESEYGQLSDARKGNIDDLIEERKNQQLLNEALLRQSPALSFQRTLSEELTPVLRDYNLELDGSERQLQNLISSYESQITNLRNSTSLTREEKDILFVLTEARKRATDALREENNQLEHNLDLRFRLRRQQRAMANLGVDSIDIPRAAGQPEEDPIAREQKRMAEFLNIKESAAKKRFNIEKFLQDSLIKLHSDSEKAKTAITEAQAEARKNRTLTAIQSVGTGLTQLFEKQKGVAIAGAIINAGAAIVRQFKDLPLWAAIPSAALVAAKTAKQIHQIASVEEGDEAVPSAGGGGAGSPSLQGFRTSEVSNQPNANVARDSVSANQPINIELHTEADNRIISKKARQGDKEIRDKAIKIK